MDSLEIITQKLREIFDRLGQLERYETGTNGWTRDPDPWIYVSATSFKIVGKNVTSRLAPGTRVKYNDGSVDYGVVATSTYAGGDTTVTLIPNTSYAIANTTLTRCYYSYATPPDYPDRFSYTPAWTGLTVVGSPTYVGHFSTMGRKMFVHSEIRNDLSSSTASGPGTLFSLPLNPVYYGVLSATDSGANNLGTGYIATNGTGYTPAWAANVGRYYYISGWCEF